MPRLDFFLPFDNLRLNVIGFLTILGGFSVNINAQVIALSRLSYLPRLVPAPQALIHRNRLERLRPLENARVLSPYPKRECNQLNYIASVVHDLGAQLPEYAVRVLDLTRNEPRKSIGKRKTTMDDGWQIISIVKWGPLQLLAVLGCAMSITLCIASICYSDGMSLLATLTLSLCSSFTGFSSHWCLYIPRRTVREQGVQQPVAYSSIIIHFPQDAFVVVRCSEEIQEELYWQPEMCRYVFESVSRSRIMSSIATLLLMAGVIFLANASRFLQILWIGAYVTLNVAYWLVTTLPAKVHWNLTAYNSKEVEIVGGPDLNALEQALWTVIAVIGRSGWVRDFEIAPKSLPWAQWLDEAQDRVGKYWNERPPLNDGTIEVPEWDSMQRLEELLAGEAHRMLVAEEARQT